jgi:hypothetical protein
MNNEDKYYTPEIEEFHIGFEYEGRDQNNNWWKLDWTTANDMDGWQVDSEGSRIDITKERTNIFMVPDYIRVKYLDKEDIESLGWKYKYEGMFEIRGFKDYAILEDSIVEPSRDNYYYITEGIIDFKNKPTGERKTIFEGTIKNKSELKRLMKQLGI